MLRITREQRLVLGRDAFERLLDSWSVELCGRDPNGSLSPQALRPSLSCGARRAVEYGLRHVWDIREYLALIVRFGFTEDGRPTTDWQLEVLESAALTGREKMCRLAARLDEIDPAPIEEWMAEDGADDEPISPELWLDDDQQPPDVSSRTADSPPVSCPAGALEACGAEAEEFDPW